MFAFYRDRLTLALIMAWCMGCQGLCEPTGTYELFDESLPDLGKSPEMSTPLTPDMGDEEMPPPPGCGDGMRQGQEECDEGTANSNEPNALCRRDCTRPRCGDGITDPLLDEQCDDKNMNDEDGCLSSCKLNVCGDGIINKAVDESTGRPFELCDDQDQDNLNYCTTLCTPCGNGVIDADAGEECDGGEFPPQNNDGCSSTCKREQFAICEIDDPNKCQLSLVSPDQEARLSGPIALEHKDTGDFTVAAVSSVASRVYVFRGTNDKSAFVEQRIDRGNDGWLTFGKALALSKDQLFVSAIEQNRGLVVEYRRNLQGRWSQHKIHRAPIPSDNNDFGYALAVDEQHLTISAPGDDAGKGAIYVYKKVGGEWELDERLTPKDATTRWGTFLSLDGLNLAVTNTQGEYEIISKGERWGNVFSSSVDANGPSIASRAIVLGDDVFAACTNCLAYSQAGEGVIYNYKLQQGSGWMLAQTIKSDVMGDKGAFLGRGMAAEGNDLLLVGGRNNNELKRWSRTDVNNDYQFSKMIVEVMKPAGNKDGMSFVFLENGMWALEGFEFVRVGILK